MGRTVVLDAPLLFESGWLLRALCCPIIVVNTPPSAQRARLMARDGVPKEEAQAAIDAQMPQAEKARLADILIRNEGSVAALRDTAATVLAAITGPTRQLTAAAAAYPRAA